MSPPSSHELMLSLLLASTKDGLPVCIDMGRVSIAAELATRAGGLHKVIQKKLGNGDTRIRLTPAFLEQLDKAIEDLDKAAIQMGDEAVKLIQLPHPSILPPPEPAA